MLKTARWLWLIRTVLWVTVRSGSGEGDDGRLGERVPLPAGDRVAVLAVAAERPRRQAAVEDAVRHRRDIAVHSDGETVGSGQYVQVAEADLRRILDQDCSPAAEPDRQFLHTQGLALADRHRRVRSGPDRQRHPTGILGSVVVLHARDLEVGV